VLATLALTLALAVASGQAAVRRTPTLAPTDTVIDGPSSDIVSLNGMSIARDGTGGLVYLKDVGGVAHVFVSRLIRGSFGPGTEVDPGLLGPSSQPAIAASASGLLLVAFINGGNLYVTGATSLSSPYSAPTALYSGASNPSLSLSNFGKGYLAFTAVRGAGSDVMAAFYYQGQWALANGVLDASPGDGAGSGSGRPEVAVSGDGIAIVVWGEAGHIYSRRVSETTLSVVDEQADPSFQDGWQEVSADDPTVSTGGDSSYATVAFQETLSNGSSEQSRVFINRLQGSQYDGIYEGDGSTPGGESADQPQAAVTEYGAGWVTSEHEQSHELFATTLGTNESPESTARVDSLLNQSAPDAAAANAGLYSTLIAWQQTPGVDGPAEIRLRYAPDGYDLGPEQVVSSPTLGATDADSGLAAGGDVAGDAAAAWVQGTGDSTRIVSAQMYQPPGSFAPAKSFRYATSANPVLSWSQSAEDWGPPAYEVTLDGTPILATHSLTVRTPVPVTDGRHTYVVTAINQAGLRVTARAATVFVDTVKPRVSFKLRGPATVQGTERITVTDSDPAPRGLPKSDASGIASAQVRWGDGSHSAITHTKSHVYQRKRTYTVTVIVKDRAGNETTVTRKLKIKVGSTSNTNTNTNTKGKGKGKGKGKTRKAMRKALTATMRIGGRG
jgi:hypothetical protein